VKSIPVIVSCGGINASGRSAFNFGYQRMVFDALAKEQQRETLLSIAVQTHDISYAEERYWVAEEAIPDLDAWLDQNADRLLDKTLIRELEDRYFDYKRVPFNKTLKTDAGEQPINFQVSKRQLPSELPANWTVVDLGDGHVEVSIEGGLDMQLTDYKRLPVSSAGQLPSGFEPADLYPSRHHPRGLQLTVYGASEALSMLGVSWDELQARVAPDEIAVYASSAMSQLDEPGTGGMLGARLQGKRVSSKQCPLSLMQMPADFINAYVIGGLGSTGAMVGACATFLYDLQVAVDAIKRGEKRLAIVGNAEAPLLPSVFEGYMAMSALATDDQLAKLDGVDTVDQRRASRPFGENTGFTLSEGAQFVVVCDDELAVELGLEIRASVTDVFVNADGYKKSISAPGVGNYITMAKAVSTAVETFGEDIVRHNSFVQAHGSSTPQNRVTESHIFSEIAKAWSINDWPVTAVKSYVGHTLGVASGDQMVCTLGAFEHGVLPRIANVTEIASDVHTEGLKFATDHLKIEKGEQLAFLNAKGFGGNNASAVVANAEATLSLIKKLRGESSLDGYAEKNNVVKANLVSVKQAMLTGSWSPQYRFDHNVLGPANLNLSSTELQIDGYNPISL